jgi:peptide/nickel transport system substrate-binding protein
VGTKKRFLAVGGTAILLLAVAACGSNRDDGDGDTPGSGATSESFILGTTDTVTALDPAGSYDLGGSTLEYNLYQTLETFPPGETDPVGDAAESCEYPDPQTFTCTLKSGLKFSNGNDLTSSDVKFSFERAIQIQDANGAAIYLLASITHTEKDGTVVMDDGAIETPDDTTVIFHLNKPDTTFRYVITYPGAGAIVDEEVFPADSELADDQIIGSGRYKLSQYKPGEQAVLEINDEYTGDAPGQAPQVYVSYYQDASALKLAVEQGEVDIAWRSLSPTDIKALQGNSEVTVAQGDGAEIRYWVWSIDDGGVGKDVAIRQAGAQIIDREAIAENAYEGTVDPLYSVVPPGFAGANEAFKDKYGEPNVDAAKQILDDAGIATPVSLTLGYSPTHYGPNAVDEATELQRQLEASGLFKVDIKSVEWEQYQTINKEGAYDLFQMGWFPDFPDADNYLAPFLINGGFFQNGYNNDEVTQQIAAEEASSDPAEREDIFGQVQNTVAEDVPLIPSWVGPNLGVYGAGIEGVESTLDPAFIFRFWLVTKNAS